jgi:hypothetical protein
MNRVNPFPYLRAAWRLLRRDRWLRTHPAWKDVHFLPLDGSGRPAVAVPALCGVEHGGNATPQPTSVGCWDCAIALARDPARWTPPPPRARWETYPDGTTVCRSCARYLHAPPGCSCPATPMQRIERFLVYQADKLHFRRLRAHPQQCVPWDEQQGA